MNFKFVSNLQLLFITLSQALLHRRDSDNITIANAKTQNVKHLHIINYFECKSLGIGIEIKINGEVD